MASSTVVVAAIGDRSWSTPDGWTLRQQRDGLWVALAPEGRVLPPLFGESMRSLIWLISAWQSALRYGTPRRNVGAMARRRAERIEGEIAATEHLKAEAATAAKVASAADEPVSPRVQGLLQRRRERMTAQLATA